MSTFVVLVKILVICVHKVTINNVKVQHKVCKDQKVMSFL